MKTITVPEYMAGFHCIGPECEANCCDNDWIIVVDKDTFRKCMEIDDPELHQKFQTQFIINPNHPSDNHYAEIKKGCNGKCPFQTKDGLCEIHQKYGTEYLSGTCNTYPRLLNMVDNHLEMSGPVSCPEIGRRLLLNPEPVSFTQIEYSSDAQFVYRIINLNTVINEWQYHTLRLRDLTIEILQDRGAILTDRLIFLGLFFQKAQGLVTQSKVEEIPRLISQFRALLKSGQANGIGQGINKNLLLQYELLKEICMMKAMENLDYREYFRKILEGLGGETANPEDGLRQYENILNDYLIPFYENHPYIFENYLVNYVFGNLFPLSDDVDIFNSYAALIIQFALIQFHLNAMSGLEKGLDEALATRTFMKVCRVFAHDIFFLPKIQELLAGKGLFNLAHLIGLFKIQ